jgi:putative phosphoribosyl transferase
MWRMWRMWRNKASKGAPAAAGAAGAAVLRRFRDRHEAGTRLAERLMAYAHRADVLALGLARGGVPVAYEVAQRLGAPLDVCIVRKLGAPGEEELAMGAIASGGVRVLNDEVVRALRIKSDLLDAVTSREERELARRERLYRGDRPLPAVQGRTIILVDDGIATGATIRAALAALHQRHPARVVVAVPVAAAATCEELRADDTLVVCVMEPQLLFGVGMWYAEFAPTTDEDIRSLLARAWRTGA